MLIGPTGVGKTEIARRLAMLVGAPFVKVEATKFTEVGYYGRDVESLVRDLVEAAVLLVKASERIRVAEEAGGGEWGRGGGGFGGGVEVAGPPPARPARLDGMGRRFARHGRGRRAPG